MDDQTKTGLPMGATEAAVLKTMEQAHEADGPERRHRNPRPLSSAQVRTLRLACEDGDYSKVASAKRAECSSYNACLNLAIAKDWEGFACTECKAFSLPDRFQMETDWLALRALQTASDRVEEDGKVSRVRGAKPEAA